jgi:hypothetical protein
MTEQGISQVAQTFARFHGRNERMSSTLILDIPELLAAPEYGVASLQNRESALKAKSSVPLQQTIRQPGRPDLVTGMQRSGVLITDVTDPFAAEMKGAEQAGRGRVIHCCSPPRGAIWPSSRQLLIGRQSWHDRDSSRGRVLR